MKELSTHRKTIHHFDEPGHFHELTFSCYRRMALLNNDPWRSMLTESLDMAMLRHGYSLIAFVYMPEHVHLLVFPQNRASRIDQLLKAIKRPFSYRIKELLAETRSPLLDELTILQRPGVTTFRFWQEGPGYDRNLISPEAALAAAQYIHRNPVRRGLVASEFDWRWSSAIHFLGSCIEPDSALPSITSLSDIVWA
ncbi:MAG: transposase [Thermodesulfobacteriota bacterium]